MKNKINEQKIISVHRAISRWVENFKAGFIKTWGNKIPVTKEYIDHQFFLLETLFNQLEILHNAKHYVHFTQVGEFKESKMLDHIEIDTKSYQNNLHRNL